MARMDARWWLAILVAAVVGCGNDTPADDDDDSANDAGAVPADAGPTYDASPPPPGDLRFVVMGDTGEGNDDQAMVAAAIKAKCDAEGCDFVVLLGDNIYDSGVDSVDDPQWLDKFETPYEDLDLPFYAVLGNHDYGGNLIGIETGGLGNEWDKGPVEVMYTDVSDKWIMPETHYTFVYENVGFIMLDTNSIMWDNIDHGDQRDWYPTALMEVSNAEWVIAAGHHTVRSNGSHGNAGTYESIQVGDIEIPNPLPILDGANVKAFFDEVVCGTVDVYFAGHDHNRQWLNEPSALCGAELVVSGAGAKLTDLADRGNATHFQDAAQEGFLYVIIDGDTFVGQFYDKLGNRDFERTFRRSQ